ncbi:MAG: 1-deoxy-D-xylulose-5-phosphate reductoisomerase [Verrucomicrobiota bacterium]|nr:1-deoxy-D-xylulose-5-phosphate reductoisomerase [Verrucomicrobiota bacterium]
MKQSACKNVVLLGATGSIGTNALRVLRKHQSKLKLIGVTAHSNDQKLADICHEFKVPHASITDSDTYKRAKVEGRFPSKTELFGGNEALIEISTLENADIIVLGVVGACGLKPALAAIDMGKEIALANKELLVLGGSFVIDAAKRSGSKLLPTDSEHNAIFQCLEGHSKADVEKLILTASGGQFRDTPIQELASVTPTDATQHPNWSMGQKITVDSATMANKGLELFEARWLFNLEPSRLEVVIHPQSIAHSFVQFIDGSILGQFTPPSMTFAIQHCLLYPNRSASVEPTLDFKQSMQWDFKNPDLARYPCLKLAYESLNAGGNALAIYNASNEIAVERFLNGSVNYLDIPRIIEWCLSNDTNSEASSVEALIEVDAQTRVLANTFKSSSV